MVIKRKLWIKISYLVEKEQCYSSSNGLEVCDHVFSAAVEFQCYFEVFDPWGEIIFRASNGYSWPWNTEGSGRREGFHFSLSLVSEKMVPTEMKQRNTPN